MGAVEDEYVDITAEQLIEMDGHRSVLLDIDFNYTGAPWDRLELGMRLREKVWAGVGTLGDRVLTALGRPRDRLSAWVWEEVWKDLVSPMGDVPIRERIKSTATLPMRYPDREVREQRAFSRCILGNGRPQGVLWYVHPPTRDFGNLYCSGEEAIVRHVHDILDEIGVIRLYQE